MGTLTQSINMPEQKVVDYGQSDNYFGDIRLKETDVLHEEADVIVSMKNVHKTYLLGVEGIPALRGVSLTIKRGEFVVVFGTSGGGKTTLLNLIGTIDKPTKGELFLCGQRINDKTSDALLAEIRLKKMGFVFQTFNLLSSLSAQENVEMPMVLAGDLTSGQRSKRSKELLKTVGLEKRLSHFPSQLSGGEQQRVTVARAISNRPELLLLDEPTGDLDSVNGAIVMDLLCQLHEQGLTLVMVTHDVHLKNFADRVIWMRDGKIQRIEENSDEAKKAARESLVEELNNARTNADKPISKTIELREPKHYETSVDYKQNDKQPKQLSIEALFGKSLPNNDNIDDDNDDDNDDTDRRRKPKKKKKKEDT